MPNRSVRVFRNQIVELSLRTPVVCHVVDAGDLPVLHYTASVDPDIAHIPSAT